MPILTSLNKKIKEPKGWKTSKKIGLALLIIATIGYSGVLTNLIPFLHTFLLGTFGLFGYILFFLMYLIGGALFAGKRYVFKLRYVFYVLVFLISILSIFHMAFLGKCDVTGYFKYLGFVYAKQTSVGGLLLGIIVYPIQLAFGNIGSYIVFAVLIVVSICLIINYLTNLKNAVKVDKIKVQVKKQPKEQVVQDNFDFNFKQKKQENVNVGIKAEIKKEETAKEIAMRKLGLTQQPVEQKQEQVKTINTRPKLSPLDNFNGTFGYNINSKPSYSKPKQNSKAGYDENIKFLQATMGVSSYIPPKQENSVETTASRKYSNFSGGVLDSKENFLSANFGIKPANDFNSQTSEESDSGFKYDPYNVMPKIDKESDVEKPGTVGEIDFNNFTLPDELKITEKERVVDFGYVKPKEIEQTSMSIDEKYNKSIEDTSVPLKHIHKKPIASAMQQTQIGEVEQIPVKEKKKKRKYNRPTIDLLTSVSTDPSEYGGNIEKNSQAIEELLNSFKVPAKIINVTKGPAVTRYELEMPVGISVKRVVNYADDIAMAVASQHGVRIEAPIPGKSAVGIEVPNEKIATVALKDVLASDEFQKSSGILNFAVGKEISGKMRVCDLQKMPHMLVAGSTGSGKSVCLNTMIISMLYKYSPEDVKFILIDPKQVEFFMFNGLPHMLLKNAITEPQKAINALKWAINEMERRYTLMTNYGVKNVTEYNKTSEVMGGQAEKVPSIVIVIDEVADLMSVCSKDLEDCIARLTAKARAAGIHIVLATQRPSVDVITGVIKTNLPSRIAFAVLNYQDSKTILDKGGAEQLLGKGDMLLQTIDMPEPKRIQGCFVSDKEVKIITDYIKQNNDCEFDELIDEVINKEETLGSGLTAGGDRNDEELDAFFVEALHLAIETGSASASMFQRRFGIGFNRAGRIIDQMTRLQYISQPEGPNKPRSVYITMEEFNEKFGDGSH